MVDLSEILKELHSEVKRIDQAILALQQLVPASQRRGTHSDGSFAGSAVGDKPEDAIQ